VLGRGGGGKVWEGLEVGLGAGWGGEVVRGRRGIGEEGSKFGEVGGYDDMAEGPRFRATDVAWCVPL